MCQKLQANVIVCQWSFSLDVTQVEEVLGIKVSAYAVDEWCNTNAMEMPSTYRPLFVERVRNKRRAVCRWYLHGISVAP